MDFVIAKQKLKDRGIISVLGDNDPYVTEKIIQEQIEYEARLGLEVKKIRFEGGHELNVEVLKSFM
jgi:predicted esterase